MRELWISDLPLFEFEESHYRIVLLLRALHLH